MSALVLLGFALQVGAANPVIVERARVDARAEVSFHALLTRDTVYVGEAARYELGVFVSDELRRRLRRNPEFVPAELRSMFAYDLRDRSAPRFVERDGRMYEVHVFQRALFPVAPGRLVVPPARLSYSVPAGTSFFSREETTVLRSESVVVVAIEPPTAGRPAKWNGAVGDLGVTLSADTRAARVGNPFVVTARVYGEGNVQLLPRPPLSVSWGSVVAGEERVIIDSLAPGVRGTKEFAWLVTPEVAGVNRLDAVEYPYFDPRERTYRVARSAPVMVNVGEGGLAPADTQARVGEQSVVNLAIRMRWSRAWPDSPDRSWPYWVVFALVPLPWGVRAVRAYIAARRRAGDERNAPRFEAGGSNPDMLHSLRRATEQRLGHCAIPWDDMTATARALRHHGITEHTVAAFTSLLSALEAASYGGSAGDPDAGQTAERLYAAIDAEARAPRPVPVTATRRSSRRAKRATRVPIAIWIASGALAVGAFAQGAHARVAQGASARVLQDVEDPKAAFERGVAAYVGGDANAASGAFFAAARARPRAVNAWANAGTASWVAQDTARAVVGWQRALRLAPTDDDLRYRLSLVGADVSAGRRDVWPLPRRALAWLALLAWCTGWTLAVRAPTHRVYKALIVAGAAAALVSVAHGRRLDAVGLAVVADPAPLRALPAMGADPGATPLAGEVVTVREQHGVWVRVEARDARSGWMDGARLLSFDGTPLRGDDR